MTPERRKEIHELVERAKADFDPSRSQVALIETWAELTRLEQALERNGIEFCECSHSNFSHYACYVPESWPCGEKNCTCKDFKGALTRAQGE